MDNKHRKRREPSFSIYEFKSWFEKHGEISSDVRENLKNEFIRPRQEVGLLKVESRLGIQRLKDQIQKCNAELSLKESSEIAERFKELGGTVSSSEDLLYTVDIEKVKFKIPKMYCKPYLD